uniref:Uncharacterized protein n=1 Tax=Sus scrofa TaxID=9823 RepID=A0A4X1UJD1_PIG
MSCRRSSDSSHDIFIDHLGFTSAFQIVCPVGKRQHHHLPFVHPPLRQGRATFESSDNIRGLWPDALESLLAAQQSQRLPFLPSSHLSLDILQGNDKTIGFEDIFNDLSQCELMGEPHLMVEYKLGLL